jgi:hypothetical protein
MAFVQVSEHYMTLLQEYRNKTGVTIDRCVSDALFDWLSNVAPATLERLGLKRKQGDPWSTIQRPVTRTLRPNRPR